MVYGICNVKSSRWLKFTWEVNAIEKAENAKNCEEKKGQSFLKRRHAVTILGFLCSVVMHSQRLNLSIAMVAMVNATSTQPETYKSNITECPISGTRNAVAETHRNGEFSWNPELQGHILGAGFLGYLLAQIPGGILAGRFGTKVILLVGLFGASICNLLSPVAAKQHAYFLAAAHLLRGIFQGLQQPAMSVLMAKWFPRNERGYLSAFIYCGYPMGAFFASLVSGALCDMEFMGGWPLVFYTFGLLGVFVGLLLVFFFVEKPEDDPKISEFELQHILQNQDNTSTISRPPTPWSQMLLSIPTYALVVALFGQYWMAFYFLSVHPTYLGTILNIPIKENGILSSGPYLAQALTGFCACWLAFWLTRNKNFNVNSLRKGANTLSCLIFTVGTIGVYFSGCDRTLNEIFLFIATGSVGFGFAGSLITAVDMSPTYCGVLMGFSASIAQTLVQWGKMFLITAAIGAGSGAVFLTLGSTDIQPWDPASAKDVNMNSPSKKQDRVSSITSCKL
ncbi:putative inorganic phosphate cotransporter [Trichonephila inaurata madagascariensis]|uniref:Putative inorganic phosphate cotransporter n=1 Tax=Trichonephila inaurata madagascariensis TaxID=2747483 RepID=A0A8X6I6M1_9ARAC|nr:putative inorganic phosphate cotransporter [Trichonephila inaurata madagascariensis]